MRQKGFDLPSFPQRFQAATDTRSGGGGVLVCVCWGWFMWFIPLVKDDWAIWLWGNNCCHPPTFDAVFMPFSLLWILANIYVSKNLINWCGRWGCKQLKCANQKQRMGGTWGKGTRGQVKSKRNQKQWKSERQWEMAIEPPLLKYEPL